VAPAAPGRVRKVHRNYHIPISNTAAGMMALESVTQETLRVS
jgi:protocatechuate 4,5-dioxygenase beta chain